MTRGVRRYLVGSLVLLALAGCGRGFLQYAEREPWRREAEVACLKSGAVREGAGLVRIEPIEGPGICGAEFPLKVAAFGENSAFGFADEAVRPPGAIPGGAQQPRWPIAQPRTTAPITSSSYPAPQAQSPQTGEPMSISPPGVNANAASPGYGAQPAYPQALSNRSMTPQRGAGPGAQPEFDDEDDTPPQTMPSREPQRSLPPLGPVRNPRVTGTVPVEVKPQATLACPIVSALDQWIMNSVQPAAAKWFGQQVVEIKQISAYSCRGMNGQPGARISEHAFGNALDIAAFVLADGRRITVKDGWKGSPEEQGFLRDVQGAACDQFTTVLAPGSNRFHYDHIHVDLMRRASGRRICQPGAVDGEQIAAMARRSPSMMALRPEPAPLRRYDPPVDPNNDPFAWRGDYRRADTTGSIKTKPDPSRMAVEDLDWVEDPSPRPKIDWSKDRHKPQ